MSYHDAITMIQRRRPQAQPIPEFVTMLQQYEITCRGPSLPAPSTTLITSTSNKYLYSTDPYYSCTGSMLYSALCTGKQDLQ